jgi:hypothetical protein
MLQLHVQLYINLDVHLFVLTDLLPFTQLTYEFYNIFFFADTQKGKSIILQDLSLLLSLSL